MNRHKVVIIVITTLLLTSISTIYIESTHNPIASTYSTITASRSLDYTVRISDSMALPNVGERFDHMSIDISKQLVFVAARGNNSIYVARLPTESVSHIITGLNKPQGVYFDQEDNQLYVSNGGDGTVDVFDVSNYHLLKVFNFSSDADNIRYDFLSGLLYVGYGEENQSGIAIINTTSNALVGTIALNGHPEAFSLDHNESKIFINVPTANAIEIASTTTREVTASWPLTNATENFPMALDAKAGLLFVGFALPPVLHVLNASTGKVVAMLNISSGADDMYFDPNSNLVLVTCSAGFLDVIRQQNVDSYTTVTTLPTGPLARTSLFFPQTEKLFVAVPQHDRLAAQLLTFSITSVQTSS